MTRKKWVFLVLCVLIVLAWFKFFYKTYDESVVSKNADCIFALDVKRVINTIIWNTITTPGQWRSVSFSSSGEISWKDMVRIPDYFFIFHVAGHPVNAWYAVLDIKDDEDFNKGLSHYQFEKRSVNAAIQEYFSNQLGIELIRAGNKILLGNSSVSDKNYIRQVANDLFNKKQFIAKEVLAKNIGAASHLSFQLLKNNVIREDAVLKINFDKQKISVDASLFLQKQIDFKENNFSYSPGSLCAFGFTQPPGPIYNLLPDAIRSKVSQAAGFNIDSLFLPANDYYSLDFPRIQSRVDSAISYSYDADFNPIEKMVINNVQEPAFAFRIKGKNVNNIYNYWNSNGKLERSAAGDLFLPMPFVRSYCRKANDEELALVSANYMSRMPVKTINCIFFFNMILTQIPGAMQNYLPGRIIKTIANIETINMDIKNDNGVINIHCSINKKKNDLPVIEW